MRKVYVAVMLAVISLSLAVPLRAYVLGVTRSVAGDIVRTRWKAAAFPIQWRLNPVQGPNVTGTRTQAEVFAASFAAWQAITTASISFTQGPDTAAAVRFGDDNINLIT